MGMTFMEKRGIIEPGRTNPEDDKQKAASADKLDDDATKRAADAVADQAKRDDERQ